MSKRISLVLLTVVLSACQPDDVSNGASDRGGDDLGRQSLSPLIRVSHLGAATIPDSESYRFESRNVSQVFRIDVTTVISPLDPPAPKELLPVVFVTDGYTLSAFVTSMVQTMAIDVVPSMIVVGIGYDIDPVLSRNDALVQHFARRARDFTPTMDEAWYQLVSTQAAPLYGSTWPDDIAPAGGADAFLAFIDDELKPFIAERYPADLENTALFGHSMGGLFVLHVLFTSPQSFIRYAAISPGAFYDNRLVLREEADFGDASAHLFMAYASEDPQPIIESTRQLDTQISTRGRSNLRYAFEVFSGETHSTVVPVGFMHAFRALFDPPRLPLGGSPPSEAE